MQQDLCFFFDHFRQFYGSRRPPKQHGEAADVVKASAFCPTRIEMFSSGKASEKLGWV